jgi:DNA-nicking Smr family endonuclease
VTKKTPTPNDEESALFRNSVGPVKSIAHNTLYLTVAAKPKPYPARHGGENAVDPLQNRIHDPLETLYQEDTMAFLSPGLQKSVLKKLRKGHYGVDAELDLHGLTSQYALKRLLEFLQYCRDNGHHCVQIIHGKGYHSVEQPVLKNELNVWLRQHQEVRAFCSTPRRAGGAGAIYVLLNLSHKFLSDLPDDDLDDY